MELNSTQKMALQFNKMAREKFQDRVEGFCVKDINNDANNRVFMVEFVAYNYFPVRLNYEKGRFGCCIVFGSRVIGIENSQKWWDEADFDVFFKELRDELELRIPDKYLRKHGWI